MQNIPAGRPLPENMTAPQRIALMRQAESILKQDPKNVQACLNMAMLLGDEARSRDAMEYLKRALSVQKKNPWILNRLVKAACAARDYRAAKMYSRKLMEIAPRDPVVLAQHASILMDMGEPKQAIDYLRKVNDRFPQSVPVLELLARAFHAAGDTKGATKMAEELQKIDPTHPDALSLIVNSRKFSPQEAQEKIPLLLQAIEKFDDGYEDREVGMSNLHYGLGKLYQEAGKPDQAFSHYADANRVRDTGTGTDYHNQKFADIKSLFNKEFYKERPDFGHDSNAPVFILGMPRSGTTLTESLCAGHSRITAGDEMIFMADIEKPLQLGMAETKSIRETLETFTPKTVNDLANTYLQNARALVGRSTPFFTDKMPHNFLRIGLIKLLFPNVKIIHVRRHPADNCVSLFTNSMKEYHNEYKTDLVKLGLYYRQYWQLMQHWREVFPGGFHELYYEDLVANTELNARNMIAYLGLEWEDTLMNRQKAQKSVRTLSAWQVRQPVYQSSAGRWKVYEKHLGPLLDAMGPVIDEYEAELARLAE